MNAGLSGSCSAAAGSVPSSPAVGASPLPSDAKARCVCWIFRRFPSASRTSYRPSWSFGPSPRQPGLLCPLLTSAGRSGASRHPQSRIRDTRQISRGKLGNLQCTPVGSTAAMLDGNGLRGRLPARPVAPASYPIFVHRAASSLWLLSDPASRRRPCQSLALHLHQVGRRTSTSKLPNMLGTPTKKGGCLSLPCHSGTVLPSHVTAVPLPVQASSEHVTSYTRLSH